MRWPPCAKMLTNHTSCQTWSQLFVIFAKSHFFQSGYCHSKQARHNDSDPEFWIAKSPYSTQVQRASLPKQSYVMTYYPCQGCDRVTPQACSQPWARLLVLRARQLNARFGSTPAFFCMWIEELSTTNLPNTSQCTKCPSGFLTHFKSLCQLASNFFSPPFQLLFSLGGSLVWTKCKSDIEPDLL